MNKISTDFFNYGTYRNPDADILKKELEKVGVSVKIIYPGRNIGRETSAGAYYTAYNLLIRGCDFKIAEEIRNNLNIFPIKDGESMPVPKYFKWTKDGVGRFLLIGVVFFPLILFILIYLFPNSKFLINLGNLINPIVVYLLFFLLLYIYLIFKSLKYWFKKNK